MPDGPPAPSAQDQIGQLLGGGLYFKLKEATEKLGAGAGKMDDPELKKRLGAPKE
jgi:hypothetical protein